MVREQECDDMTRGHDGGTTDAPLGRMSAVIPFLIIALFLFVALESSGPHGKHV
jgi:hypothetical protein